MEERFKKPTGRELVDFAILFNEGKLERDKLADMVGFCQMVIDRLYDNGDILEKSQNEKDIEIDDDHYRNFFDSPSEFRE